MPSDRPIVYACRYYFPPGDTRKSYSHLYRIRPDGTGRRQLTHATADDIGPMWSPDGSKIAFLRQARPSLVVTMDAEGRKETVVATLKEFWADYHWTANNQLVVKEGEATSSHPDIAPYAAKLVLRKGQTVALPQPRGDSPKLPTLLLLETPESKPLERRLTLAPAVAKALGDDGLKDYNQLWALPGDPEHFLFTAMQGNSTDGHWRRAVRVSAKTGVVDRVLDYNDLAIAPDHHRYATYFGRDLAAYGKKTVWVSPLLIGDLSRPDAARPLVKGLAFVQGCDWRGGTLLQAF